MWLCLVSCRDKEGSTRCTDCPFGEINESTSSCDIHTAVMQGLIMCMHTRCQEVVVRHISAVLGSKKHTMKRMKKQACKAFVCMHTRGQAVVLRQVRVSGPR